MGTSLVLRSVVAAVDSSVEALAAVDLAGFEASLRHAPLHVVVGCPDVGSNGSPVHAGADCPLDRIARERVTARARRRVRMAWPDVAVTAETWHGDLAERATDVSRGASVVVVAGGPVRGGPLPGSAGDRVAAHAYCPTVVVPPGGGHGGEGPVLLGTCALAGEERATAFAFEEAALRGVTLCAVHVWAGIPPAAYDCVDPFAYELRSACAAADRLLAEELAGWAEKYPQVRVDRQARYDVNPAQALLRASRAAGLVVVGARRPGVPSAMRIGTVTRALTAQAACPVAVVRLDD